MVLWWDRKFWCRFLICASRYYLPPVSAAASGHFDTPPGSPIWSFCGTPVPTPVWQCFQLGCRIRFLLPNTETPWQKAEVLALKDHEAMKIDSRNSYQYAPNGLVLVQVRNMYTVFSRQIDWCYKLIARIWREKNKTKENGLVLIQVRNMYTVDHGLRTHEG